MPQRLSPTDKASYRAVDEVLHYLWDPIGVRDAPQARDEYHSYLPQVFMLVRRGAEVGEIADHLSAITAEHIGLSPNAGHDREIADVLLEWRGFICDQQG